MWKQYIKAHYFYTTKPQQLKSAQRDFLNNFHESYLAPLLKRIKSSEKEIAKEPDQNLLIHFDRIQTKLSIMNGLYYCVTSKRDFGRISLGLLELIKAFKYIDENDNKKVIIKDDILLEALFWAIDCYDFAREYYRCKVPFNYNKFKLTLLDLTTNNKANMLKFRLLTIFLEDLITNTFDTNQKIYQVTKQELFKVYANLKEELEDRLIHNPTSIEDAVNLIGINHQFYKYQFVNYVKLKSKDAIDVMNFRYDEFVSFLSKEELRYFLTTIANSVETLQTYKEIFN